MAQKIIIGLVILVGIGFSVLYFSPEKRKNRHYAKGVIYLKKQEYDKAISEFNSALEIVPDYKDARLQLIIAYQRNRDIDKAIDGLKGFIKDFPKNKEANLVLIRILKTQKKYQNALNACDNFLQSTI